LCVGRPVLNGTTRGITVDEGSFRMVGVVIWVEVMAVNCIGNNDPPWRGGTRTNTTELWW